MCCQAAPVTLRSADPNAFVVRRLRGRMPVTQTPKMEQNTTMRLLAMTHQPTRFARRQFALDTVQSGLVAFGAGLSDVVAFGTVSPDVVAFGLGAVPFEEVVFVAVPLGGVALGAFGVCTPWEKVGTAIKRDRSGKATESSLRITNPFMAMGVVMPGISRACTKINVTGGLGGTTAGATPAWSSVSSWM